ncbi:MAG: hypothetical protein HOV81_28095 [Kofleriaceae bacterium]|nr:hypothetical protein [Kofleriaceae bacterium]
MATDDEATAPKLTPVPSPSGNDVGAAKEREIKEASDKLNERLTERIRQGTNAPEDKRSNPPEDKLNETIRQRLEHLVPELVKKTFAAGMGAVFSTEEGIRKIAREVSLPDVVGYVASTADGAKDKVFEIVARETREFLSNLNLTEEIAKILTTLSFEIKTEIRFIPNSEKFIGSEPDVKASVRVKRADEGKDGAESEKRSRLRFWRRDGEPGDPGDDDDSGGHDR